jgi:hypothetical protein
MAGFLLCVHIYNKLKLYKRILMATVNDEYQKPNKHSVDQVSDEQLKALAVQQFEQQKSHAPATEKEKYDFPTEIVELPSKGLLYPTDNPLSSGKVEMKYMTAREEDILTTPSLIKQGVVLDRLFQSLIVGNGLGQKINYGDLLAGDKNAIMIAARVLGYGKDYEVKLKAPSGEEQSEVIDISELQHKEIDDSLFTPGQNRFKLTLPVSKRSIEVKLLTHDDEKRIDEATAKAKKYNKLRGVESNVTIRLQHIITAVDGNTDRGYITEFVENYFLARDIQYVREFLAKIQPDVELTLTFTDAGTGEPFEAQLPIGVDFFWPSARV